MIWLLSYASYFSDWAAKCIIPYEDSKLHTANHLWLHEVRYVRSKLLYKCVS